MIISASILVILCLLLAAVIGWLTAAAQLADMHAGFGALRDAVRAMVEAWRQHRAGGMQAVDFEALRRGIRPIVRIGLAVVIFGGAPAAVYEAATTGHVGLFAALWCLALALGTAAATPCPWIRFVLFGDRRRTQQPFEGADRRAD
jgi:hypothetical protein